MLFLFDTGYLQHAAFGGHVAFKDHQPTALFDGVLQAMDDLLAWSLFDSGHFLLEGFAGNSHALAVSVTAIKKALGDDRNATGLIHIHGEIFAGRFDINQQRRSFANLLEIVDIQFDAGILSHGQQVQHGVGGSAGSGDGSDGIVEGGAGADVARLQVFVYSIHDDGAAIVRNLVLALVYLGNAGHAHGAEANDFHHGSHGVGGKLAAASAGAGASIIFNFFQFRIRNFAGGAGAHCFKHILNTEFLAVQLAGQYGAAVENNAWDIQPKAGHGRAGNGFIASHQANQAVEHITTGGEFDGIGDEVARDKRGLHSFGAHSDAIGNCDGVELHWSAAGGANARLNMFGEGAQVEVARHRFNPCIGNANDRLAQVFVREADGFQHGAGGRAVPALGDRVALKLHEFHKFVNP